MIFKDTHVIERPKSQSVFLAKTYWSHKWMTY
jgi:hypothetical protein